MPHRLVAAVLVGSLVLGAVACSGGNKDNTISKDEFLKQANKICVATRKDIRSQAADLNPDDPQALTKYVVATSTAILDEIQQLRDLGFPPNDDKLLDGALTVYEEKFTEWQSDPAAAAKGADDKQLQDASKVLTNYGLPNCGASTKGGG